MKLLLTNDDGIDAPGLAALDEAARRLGDPVIVAPLEAHSGCSHRVTTDGPIRIETRDEYRYAVAGTPADCVRLGLDRIVRDAAWVLSGINAGGNLGADVYLSGTVAAVREAVLHGWPGIAVSHYRKRGREIHWGRAVRWVAPLLADLATRPWQRGSFWNINLPHLDDTEPDPAVVFCRLDPSPLPLSFRHEADSAHYDGDYHQRQRESGTDVDNCFQGKIAVSLVSLF
jgi:5'-nucleotidase